MPEKSKKALNRKEQAGSEFSLTSNRENELVVHPLKPPYEITIDLQVDPKDLESSDDKYILSSTDEKKSYEQTLTAKDDRIEGDDRITLTFRDLDPDLSYTLIVDPGFGDPQYALFTEVSYPDLKMAEEEAGYFDQEEKEEPEEEQEETEVDKFTQMTDEDEHDDSEVDEIYDEMVDEEGLKDK